ncbi:MAG: FAD-dependent oxidoreductase [Ignavibacteriales bacterium]|nr:FAD-dependent oxidoreductase [Ignavibacteriales bacterium]
MKQRILVVGGVAAGPSAASKAKRVNPNADVTLFEQGEHISYGICELPYYIGNEVKEKEQLITYTPQRLEQVKGVKVKIFHRVEEIRAVKKQLVVRDLDREKVQEYEYDRLVLATGAKSRRLGLDNEDARNVFRVNSLSEGYALKQFIEEEKPLRALIVGGGYIGMEMCEALVNNGIETTLLHQGELPMSGLEQEARKAVLGELVKNGVHFKRNIHCRRLKANEKGNVVAVDTSGGEFSADLVILSLGVEPNVELCASARIHLGPNGGITTDQRQATNVDTIFAGGDCCEVKNLVNNKWMYIPLATTASKQGWVAGENAAGGKATFKGAIRAVAVKVFGLEVAQVGISSEEARQSGFDVVSEHISGDSKISFYPGNAKVFVHLIADKKSRRVLGANVYGGVGSVLRANTLGVAIQQRLTVDEVFRLDMIYSPPFAPLWDPILIAANQLSKRF